MFEAAVIPLFPWEHCFRPYDVTFQRHCAVGRSAAVWRFIVDIVGVEPLPANEIGTEIRVS